MPDRRYVPARMVASALRGCRVARLALPGRLPAACVSSPAIGRQKLAPSGQEEAADMTTETITMAILTHPYQVMLAAVALFHAVRAVLAVEPKRALTARMPEAA